jgi:probable rRNA maturation factor
MEINIVFDEGLEGCLDAGWLCGIARQALVAEGMEEGMEMGLVIASQEHMQELNRTYRRKDRPTDVLSFAMLSEPPGNGGLSFATPPDGLTHLGEVILSYPQVVRQAAEHGHSVRKEAGILIIHGVLHLLGYDHIKDEEACRMGDREAEILKTVEAEL